jgi:CRISPR-associated protein Cmr2
VPKSSLDGQRESVLKPPEQPTGRGDFRARFRIRDGEQLDVLGLVKRVAGGHRPYPSVARIALDPWIRGNLHRLQPVIAACHALEQQNIIRRLDTSAYKQFADFPYEGTVAYVNRHHELCEDTKATDNDLRPLRDALSGLPQPEPYLAVLVADGDRMGAAIASLPSADEHRKFSRDLAAFAGEAQRVVNEHRGVLVYAGGDDVLAFLPVDTCLACARALHDAFRNRLAGYGALTLSVGIAIAHFMENLEDLLAYGRAAEKAAKEPDRDGLAVHLHKRGGAPIKVREPWSTSPDVRWMQYAQLIRAEAIPSKLPHDLRQLADLYAAWSDPTTIQAAMQQDVLRVIRDKQPKAGRTYMGHVEQIVRGLYDVRALHAFA